MWILTQTGDFLGIVITAILAIAFMASLVGFVSLKKQAASKDVPSESIVKKGRILSGIIAILAVLTLLNTLSIFAPRLFAVDSSSFIKTDAKVTAYVDEESGNVEIDPANIQKLQNNVIVNAIKLDYSDEISISDPVKWNINISGTEVYNAPAGQEVPCYKSIDNEVVKYSLSGMSKETAISLIGRQVVQVDFSAAFGKVQVKLNNDGHGKYYFTPDPAPGDQPVDFLDIEKGSSISTYEDLPGNPGIWVVEFEDSKGDTQKIYVIPDPNYAFENIEAPATVDDSTQIQTTFKSQPVEVDFNPIDHGKIYDNPDGTGTPITKKDIDFDSTIVVKDDLTHPGQKIIEFTNDKGDVTPLYIIPDTNYEVSEVDLPVPPKVGEDTTITVSFENEKTRLPLDNTGHVKYKDDKGNIIDSVDAGLGNDITVTGPIAPDGKYEIKFTDDDGNNKIIYAVPDENYKIDALVPTTTKVTPDTKFNPTVSHDTTSVQFNNDGKGKFYNTPTPTGTTDAIESMEVDLGSTITTIEDTEHPGQWIVTFQNDEGDTKQVYVIPNDKFDEKPSIHYSLDEVVAPEKITKTDNEITAKFKEFEYKLSFKSSETEEGTADGKFYDAKSGGNPVTEIYVHKDAMISSQVVDQDSGKAIGKIAIVDEASGQTYEVFARGEDGYQFDNFTNLPSKVEEAKDITANFKASEHKLKFKDDTNGKIYSTPDGTGSPITEAPVVYNSTVKTEPDTEHPNVVKIIVQAPGEPAPEPQIYYAIGDAGHKLTGTDPDLSTEKIITNETEIDLTFGAGDYKLSFPDLENGAIYTDSTCTTKVPTTPIDIKGLSTITSQPLSEDSDILVLTVTPEGTGTPQKYYVKADPGYVFEKYTDKEGTEITFPIDSVTGDLDIKAVFKETSTKVTISYSVTPEGSGLVDRASDQILPVSGTVNQIKATAATGYKFVNWTCQQDAAFSNPNSIFTPSKADDNSSTIWTTRTYVANFEIDDNTFTLSYDANGATGSIADDSVTEKELSHEFTVKGSTELSNPGYTFVGWANSKAATTKDYSPGDKLSLGVGEPEKTLYAVWEAGESVTISYVLAEPDKGGSLNRYEESVSPLAPSAQGSTASPATGYEFDYWSINNDTTHLYSTPTFSPSKADDDGSTIWTTRTYKAHFKVKSNTFKLKYNANGGSGSEFVDTQTATSLTYNFTIKNATDTGLSKGGYKLDGWSKTEGGTSVDVKVGSTFDLNIVNSPTTLYAVWSLDVFTVYFINDDTNGAVYSSPTGGTAVSQVDNVKGTTVITSQEYSADNNIQEIIFTFTPEGGTSVSTSYYAIGNTGYKFSNFSETLPISVVADTDITLNFEIASNTFTLKYEGNGATSGSVADDTWTGTALNHEFTVKAKGDLTWEGHKFDGWAESADGSVAYAAGAKLTLELASSPKTLYAHWSEGDSVTITYSVNNSDQGSVSPTSVEVSPLAETAAGSTATPNTGYKFSYWSCNGVTVGTDATLVPKKNDVEGQTLWTERTYIAHFEIDDNTFTLKYNNNGGQGSIEDQTYTDNVLQHSFTTASSGFTRGGYKLDGWAISSTGEKVCELGGSYIVYIANPTKTLFAHWDYDTYSVPLNTDTNGKFYKDSACTQEITSNVDVLGTSSVSYTVTDGIATITIDQPGSAEDIVIYAKGNDGYVFDKLNVDIPYTVLNANPITASFKEGSYKLKINGAEHGGVYTSSTGSAETRITEADIKGASTIAVEKITPDDGSNKLYAKITTTKPDGTEAIYYAIGKDGYVYSAFDPDIAGIVKGDITTTPIFTTGNFMLSFNASANGAVYSSATPSAESKVTYAQIKGASTITVDKTTTPGVAIVKTVNHAGTEVSYYVIGDSGYVFKAFTDDIHNKNVIENVVTTPSFELGDYYLKFINADGNGGVYEKNQSTGEYTPVSADGVSVKGNDVVKAAVNATDPNVYDITITHKGATTSYKTLYAFGTTGYKLSATNPNITDADGYTIIGNASIQTTFGSYGDFTLSFANDGHGAVYTSETPSDATKVDDPIDVLGTTTVSWEPSSETDKKAKKGIITVKEPGKTEVKYYAIGKDGYILSTINPPGDLTITKDETMTSYFTYGEYSFSLKMEGVNGAVYTQNNPVATYKVQDDILVLGTTVVTSEPVGDEGEDAHRQKLTVSQPKEGGGTTDTYYYVIGDSGYIFDKYLSPTIPEFKVLGDTQLKAQFKERDYTIMLSGDYGAFYDSPTSPSLPVPSIDVKGTTVITSQPWTGDNKIREISFTHNGITAVKYARPNTGYRFNNFETALPTPVVSDGQIKALFTRQKFDVDLTTSITGEDEDGAFYASTDTSFETPVTEIRVPYDTKIEKVDSAEGITLPDGAGLIKVTKPNDAGTAYTTEYYVAVGKKIGTDGSFFWMNSMTIVDSPVQATATVTANFEKAHVVTLNAGDNGKFVEAGESGSEVTEVIVKDGCDITPSIQTFDFATITFGNDSDKILKGPQSVIAHPNNSATYYLKSLTGISGSTTISNSFTIEAEFEVRYDIEIQFKAKDTYGTELSGDFITKITEDGEEPVDLPLTVPFGTTFAWGGDSENPEKGIVYIVKPSDHLVLPEMYHVSLDHYTFKEFDKDSSDVIYNNEGTPFIATATFVGPAVSNPKITFVISGEGKMYAGGSGTGTEITSPIEIESSSNITANGGLLTFTGAGSSSALTNAHPVPKDTEYGEKPWFFGAYFDNAECSNDKLTQFPIENITEDRTIYVKFGQDEEVYFKEIPVRIINSEEHSAGIGTPGGKEFDNLNLEAGQYINYYVRNFATSTSKYCALDLYWRDGTNQCNHWPTKNCNEPIGDGTWVFSYQLSEEMLDHLKNDYTKVTKFAEPGDPNPPQYAFWICGNSGDLSTEYECFKISITDESLEDIYKFKKVTVSCAVDDSSHGSVSSALTNLDYGRTYSISGNKISIVKDAWNTLTITFTANSGWELDKWLINGEEAPASGIITGDTTFTAKTIAASSFNSILNSGEAIPSGVNFAVADTLQNNSDFNIDAQSLAAKPEDAQSPLDSYCTFICNLIGIKLN